MSGLEKIPTNRSMENLTMSEIIDNLKFPDGRGEEKYPWKEWLNGGVWHVKQGEDFDVDIASMRSCIYMAAKRHGKKVKTHIPKKRNSIYIQAIGNVKDA